MMRALAAQVRRLAPDLLGGLGAGALLYGIAQLSVPAAWISAGVLMIAGAIGFARAEGGR